MEQQQRHHTHGRALRVGYYMSESKVKNNAWDSVVHAGTQRGVTLVRMDLDRPLEEQGPFDRVLYKLTNELVVDHTDPAARAKVAALAKYLADHPEVEDSEPTEKQRRFLDRETLYRLLADLDSSSTGHLVKVRCPRFLVLKEKAEDYSGLLLEAGVRYPVIAKALQACGSPASHMMGIVFSEKLLHCFEPPVLVQEYFNHNAVIFKVFVIGKFLHVVRRPSLRNFEDRNTQQGGPNNNIVENEEALIFNSQEPPPPHLFDPTRDVQDTTSWPGPPKELLRELSEALQRLLGVHLLGFDVITRKETGEHAVIDVNYFPSYKGVPDMADRMIDFLMASPAAEAAKTS